LAGSITIAILASFAWGVLSILLSPCHLSSIPLIIGYINKQGAASPKSALANSTIFALGILLTIAVIGIITSMLGGLIGDIGTIGNYLVALVFFLAGLYLLDIIKLDWNSVNLGKVRSKGYLMAFILGLLFGFGLGPCTFAFMAPVLGVAFHYSGTSMINAVILLSAFAIGHCAVIAGAGTLSAKIGRYLNWSENSRTILVIKRICGILVIFGGIYFIYVTF
jgi:cytochrome c-type biogenesis protein